MISGVILYGPPAAGKNTITHELHLIDRRYGLFRRLKSGVGRLLDYRTVSDAELNALRQHGGIIWENERYGSVYVIDREYLSLQLSVCVPVVHLGQAEAVEAVVNATAPVRWLVVSVWCSRDIAAKRLLSRSPSDIAARLEAWDDTQPLGLADLAFDTGEVSAEEAARQIHLLAHL